MHLRIPDMIHWPNEEGQSKEVQKERIRDGRRGNIIDGHISGDMRSVNGSSPASKKSKFPIDEYLDPSIISHKDEMFPLPPLSPPPPSPSHKAMQNAEDLLQAAQLFLMNISMDLKTGSRSLDRSTESPDQGSLLPSRFSGESNPLVVKKVVNTALGSYRGRSQYASDSDVVKKLKISPQRKKHISVREEKQTNILLKDFKNAETRVKATFSSDCPETTVNQDLTIARKSVGHAFELAQSVNKHLRRDRSPKSTIQQKRVIDSQCNILTKSPSQISLDSGGGSQNYSEAEWSDLLTADPSSPSSGFSSKCKVNAALYGRKPPPNSPVSIVQSLPKSGIRAIRINRSRSSPCIVPRVRTEILDKSDLRENNNGAVPFRSTVDKSVGPDAESSGIATAVDVGVNTSYTLLKGVLTTSSSNLVQNTEVGKLVSKQTVRFSLDNHSHHSGERGDSAEETNMPIISPATSNIPVNVDFKLPSLLEEEVSGTNAEALNVNEPRGPSVAPSIIADSYSSNHRDHSEVEADHVAHNPNTSQQLMDNFARNVSFDELVEDISATREILSPKEMETNAYIEGNSLTALIENILLNQIQKVAGETEYPRSRMNNIREEPKEVAFPPSHSDRESENVVDELEKEMKRILLEDQDLMPEELTVKLERVLTPPKSPSPVDPFFYEKEEDDVIVPTPTFSPPIVYEDDNKKLEYSELVKVKTPPVTPKRIIEVTCIPPSAEQEMREADKIPTTPRSQIMDSIIEEVSHAAEEVDPVSTPTLTPSLIQISAEQLHSHSNSMVSTEGKLETEDPLSDHSEKSSKFVLMHKQIPCKAKEIEKAPSSASTKDNKHHLESTELQFSKIRTSFLRDEKSPSKVMIDCETQTDAEKKVDAATSILEEPVQIEKYQDPDTTASFSMDPENEDASEADKSFSCLSEGQVKLKSTSDIKVVNLDSVSMGEIVSGKMAAAGRNFDTLSSGNLHTSSRNDSFHQLTETWSEGEVRDKWAMIHSNASSSTASDGSKSSGEISGRAFGSIPSEGELLHSDQDK